MHPTSPHRARIIAGPSAHADAAPAAPSPQLRRQAELFRLLRAGAVAVADADAPREHAAGGAPAAGSEPPPEPEALLPMAEAHDQQRDDGNERGDERSGDDGSHDSETSEHESDRAPGGSAATYAPTEPRIGAAYGASALGRHGTPAAAVPATANATANATQDVPRLVESIVAAYGASALGRHGTPAAAVSAVSAPANATQDVPRLVESIVSQVADFCSNPAVLARGSWHITIPIDPALLPACTLSLALSHFDLTLRFDTTDERSRQLILKHAATLRESLEQVMQTRFDAPRSIEIIVT